MNDSLSNPIGLDGIEFIEFASPEPRAMEELFYRLGFKKWGRHKSKKISLFRQNQVNFILNEDEKGFAAQFAGQHGPSIVATGFRVSIPAAKAQSLVEDRGAKALEGGEESGHSFPGIYGIGESAIYFIDEYQGTTSIYDDDFTYLNSSKSHSGYGLEIIDHLTNNVPKGEMKKWCNFYERIFDFREVRHFDIKGDKTGLVSKVMRSPCGKITIPINEPTDKKSQIQEYLEEYKGSGIQHLALLTSDIVPSVSHLREQGIEFLDVPDTYYEVVEERVPNVKESIDRLRRLKILVDGDQEGYLLQLFTQNLIGPIFFEVIQRKNHFGFGEGNFQALFDAIERDQMRRGYLQNN